MHLQYKFKTTNNKTPFEILFHRMPNYTFLKPFGCACFPNIVASSSNKLKSRSVHCVFLGYFSHYKGYRCLDPVTRCVYMSYHVCFHENQYLFSHLMGKASQVTHPYVFSPMEIRHFTPTTSYSVCNSMLNSPVSAPSVPDRAQLYPSLAAGPSSLSLS